jgi:hypothetical protein
MNKKRIRDAKPVRPVDLTGVQLVLLSARIDDNNRVFMDLLETSSGRIFTDIASERFRHLSRLIAELKRRKTASGRSPKDYGILSLNPFVADKSSPEYKRSSQRWQILLEKLDQLFLSAEDGES